MLFQCCQIRRQANSSLVNCKEMKELANLTALKVGVIIFNIFTERLVGIGIDKKTLNIQENMILNLSRLKSHFLLGVPHNQILHHFGIP